MTPTTRRRIDLRDDAGTTLLEMVVAMAMLTVFMGIFTVATTMMTRASTEVKTISDAVDQGNTAFLSLEKSVRYATGISTPTKSTAGTWHVELSSRVQGDGTATDLCTQLRVASGQLQSRTWVPNGAVPVTGSVTTWKPMASGVTNGTAATGADQPFAFAGANSAAASGYQRLTVLLVTSSGTADNRTSHRTTSTFTALNSTADNNPATVCNQASLKDAS